MKNIVLNERKKKILEATVRDYLHTAEPVGSRSIWRSHMPDLSPATIRNEMADLEEMGLIIQPHTSAGRIPTDTGYRYYVDHLMKARPLTVKEEEAIRDGLKETRHNVEDALHQTLKILSQLLEYASLIAVLGEKSRVYASGLSRMLKQPEFSDMKHARHMLETMEEEDLLVDLVREYTTEQGVTIHIGAENSFREVRECTVVISSYAIKNGATGGLGVIGPKRMGYARVAGILESLSRKLENLTND
jgi:transcriptional regulator of heat shock response